MSGRWIDILGLPELIELRRRRRVVTASLGGIAAALFTTFLVGFAAFPQQLGDHDLLGVPLSLWVVFSQFVGTWVLVYSYFRASRVYIAPAVDAALAAIDPPTATPSTGSTARKVTS